MRGTRGFRFQLACVAGLVCTAAAVRPAHACGGLVQPVSGSVGLDAQRAFFAVTQAGTTHVVVQIGVPATPNDYGILLPAPVQPMLAATPVSVEELDALDAATQPSLLLTGGGGGGGCGCGAALDGASNGSNGVTVAQVVEIGPVVAVVLSANTVADLNMWLGDNGFVIPAGFDSVVANYTGPDQWLVAFKRSAAASTAQASSVGVRMTLQGDHRDFAMRMAAMGAGGEVAITVFVGAPEGVGPAGGYAALTLTDLDKATWEDDSYRAAVKAAVTAAGGRAFVVEGIYNATVVTGATLSALVDRSGKLTRLTTVMTPQMMDRDVAFNAAPPAEVPTELVAANARSANVTAATAAAPAGLGVLLLALLGALESRTLLRRRK